MDTEKTDWTCRAEAQALLDSDCTAERAALQLGPFCDMAIVTDGANGSCISAMGHLQVSPLTGGKCIPHGLKFGISHASIYISLSLAV